MDTSIQRLLMMKKFIFWIMNKCSHSNWKTIWPRLKFLWSFGFLSWLSTYLFITNCGLNGYVYILEIILVILDKHTYDSRNVCGCLTLNEMLMKLASLIICSINDNLVIKSSTLPPEVKTKKTVPYIVNLIFLCTSIETLFTGTLRIKSLTYFRHQIDITVVLLFCGSFFKY